MPVARNGTDARATVRRSALRYFRIHRIMVCSPLKWSNEWQDPSGLGHCGVAIRLRLATFPT